MDGKNPDEETRSDWQLDFALWTLCTAIVVGFVYSLIAF